jgi:WD40 repeat protein
VTPSVQPATPPIPDYQLLREVGRGAYGSVWLARSITGLYRAVKIVWRSGFEDPAPYEREFRGIKEFAAISIQEPRQLALLHVGRDDAVGFFYYVMELADDAETGREIDPERYVPYTLQALGRRRGRLPAAEALALAVDLSGALAGLHSHGLVHRDIKPSNIIFVGGVAKLADIGLVTLAANDDASISRVGNLGYMPPDFPGTPSADVYGLAKVLYELVTGRNRSEYPRLPADLDTLPDRKAVLELNDIMTRACAPDPARRYPDAVVLREELLLLQAGKSVRRLRAAERHLRRTLRVAALLAIVAAVAGSGAWTAWRIAKEEMAKRAEAEAQRDDLRRKTVYSSGLARAQRSLETNDLGSARRLLQELAPRPGEPDLRGFEWHALVREAQGDPAEVFRESGQAMQRVRFSPDGKLVAGQDIKMVVTVWEVASRRVVQTIPRLFHLVGFSSDSRWLVGQDAYGLLQRWQVSDGEPEPPIDKNRNNRLVGTFGEGGIVCFTIGKDAEPHSLRSWDFATRLETFRLPLAAESGQRLDYYGAALSSDGVLCALSLIRGRVQDADWRLQIYDLSSKSILHQEPIIDRISALAFSPDRTRLAAAFGNTTEIALFDLTQKRWLWKKKVGASRASALSFSPDGRRIATGGRHPIIGILDAETGEVIDQFRGQAGGVEDVRWANDGRALGSAGTGGDLRIWDLTRVATPNEITGLWQPAGGGRKVVLSADGSLLAASDDPKKGALLKNLVTRSPAARLPGPTMPIAFTSDAKTLVAISNDGMLQKWRLAGEPELAEQTRLFNPPVSVGSSAALSDNHARLTVGSAHGRVLLWNMEAKQSISDVTAHPDFLWFAATSGDGKWAISIGGTDVETAVLWDLETGIVVQPISGSGIRRTCASFAPDSSVFALGRNDGSIEIRAVRPDPKRNIHATMVLHTIQTDSSRIQIVAFSPDGTRLFCGGPEGTIHVIAADDWREVVALRIPVNRELAADSTVSSLAISADGKTAAAYLNDGRIRLFRR